MKLAGVDRRVAVAVGVVLLALAVAAVLLLGHGGATGVESLRSPSPTASEGLVTASPATSASASVPPSPSPSPEPSPSAAVRPSSQPTPSRSSTARPGPSVAPSSSGVAVVQGGLGFSYGPLQWSNPNQNGCGTNGDGEPAVHVNHAGFLFLGSEEGLGAGSDGWAQNPTTGGPGANACNPIYVGQPNPVPVANGGGDIDLAWGSATLGNGNYPLYVASLNGGSITVSVSRDNGHTFTSNSAQSGLPGDDREWIAANGSGMSLLSFHDPNGDIEILRATSFGGGYASPKGALQLTYAYQGNNEIGNIAIDHGDGTAYQAFVGNANLDEVGVSVSTDGGVNWSPRMVPCSVNRASLDHQFPNVSVAPDHHVWMSWSDDAAVYTAMSTDQGNSWTCFSGRVSTTTARAIMPWMVAGAGGVDLVYYGTTDQNTWYVYFQQFVGSWRAPSQLMPVHQGPVCELGATCTGSGNRQLYDDFGVDVDPQGYAHIAYSHDSPDLGGANTYTGYAVQTGGQTIGGPN